jgi:sterol desaturase/sphingolipid hydroxylase (fatty acid hydroxylase superfamily)
MEVLLVCGLFYLGFVYAQLLEWLIHKHLLHRLGKDRKNKFFAYHFYEHHRTSRNNLFYDNPSSKETLSILLLLLLHLPISMFSFALYGGVFAGALRYYYVHRRAHLEPEWCKKYYPWHYAHHMATTQEMNWGVTTDKFDKLFGTRLVYVGTEKEKKDTQRRINRLDKRRNNGRSNQHETR